MKRFNWFGSMLIVCGLEGGTHKWNSCYNLGLMLGGIASLATFGLYEARYAKNLLVPMSIFEGISKFAALSTDFFQTFVIIS